MDLLYQISIKDSGMIISLTGYITILVIIILLISFLYTLHILSTHSNRNDIHKYKKMLILFAYLEFYLLLWIGLCGIDMLIDIYNHNVLDNFVNYLKNREMVLFMLLPVLFLNYRNSCDSKR